MSSTTANPELHAFQVTVRDKIDEIGNQYGYRHITDRVKRDLGLDNLVEDVTVTVKVTIPAAGPSSAVSAVQDALADLYLPTGWAAEVDA